MVTAVPFASITVAGFSTGCDPRATSARTSSGDRTSGELRPGLLGLALGTPCRPKGPPPISLSLTQPGTWLPLLLVAVQPHTRESETRDSVRACHLRVIEGLLFAGAK